MNSGLFGHQVEFKMEKEDFVLRNFKLFVGGNEIYIYKKEEQKSD